MHVEELKGPYAAAKRQDKMIFARKIVERVQGRGGKFLNFKGDINEEVYIEISEERKIEKACQALRENREGRCKTRNQGVQMKRDLAKLAAGKSNMASSAIGKAKNKKPPQKSTEATKQTKRPNEGVANKSRALWQTTELGDRVGGGIFEDPMEEDAEEDSFEDANPPEMNESTASDSISGTHNDDDDDGFDTVSEYDRYMKISQQRKRSTLLRHPGLKQSQENQKVSLALG